MRQFNAKSPFKCRVNERQILSNSIPFWWSIESRTRKLVGQSFVNNSRQYRRGRNKNETKAQPNLKCAQTAAAAFCFGRYAIFGRSPNSLVDYVVDWTFVTELRYQMVILSVLQFMLNSKRFDVKWCSCIIPSITCKSIWKMWRFYQSIYSNTHWKYTARIIRIKWPSMDMISI